MPALATKAKPPVRAPRDPDRIPRDAKSARGKRAVSRWQPPRWLRFVGRHKVAALASISALALGGAGAWAWQADVGTSAVAWSRAASQDAFVRLQVASGLVVSDVTVEGRTETAGADLLAALGVQRGDLLMSFDPDAARARIEQLGWVRSAMVSRLLPNRIHVEVTERRPFALWQSDRRLALIDREGAVITDRGLGQFSLLPMIVGADAAPLAAALLDRLAQVPVLNVRVRAAVRVGGRRWDVHLDNGVVVKLPEEAAAAAWARLAELDSHYRVVDRAVMVIDLRLPDRLVLRLEPPAPPKPPAQKPKPPVRPA